MSSPAAPRAKRLTLSEVIELLLARGSTDHSSVTLARNAKGETQIEVVVRSSELGSVTTAAEAAVEAKRLYDELRGFYPPAEKAEPA